MLITILGKRGQIRFYIRYYALTRNINGLSLAKTKHMALEHHQSHDILIESVVTHVPGFVAVAHWMTISSCPGPEEDKLYSCYPQICVDIDLEPGHHPGHQWDNCHLHKRLWKSHFGIFGWFRLFTASRSYVLLNVDVALTFSCLAIFQEITNGAIICRVFIESADTKARKKSQINI